MTEPRDRRDRRDEETISAIKPALDRTPSATAEARRRAAHTPWIVTGVVLLLGLAFGVFFVLPGVVAERSVTAPPPAESPAAAAEAAEAAPEEPELSEEELAALQQEAEDRLSDLLPQQSRLAQRAAESWGGEQWARYEALAETGDDAFLAEDYAAAGTAYAEAIEVGEALLERSVTLVSGALEAGQRALEAGHARLAAEQFDIVLNIDPENEAAQRGRERAEQLPDVLDAMERGDALRKAQEYAAAAEAYREALALDPAWSPARGALEAVQRSIRDARYERSMSAGLSALTREDYGEARQHFTAALELEPGSAEAGDGLAQAEQGLKLDEIALAEARALAFERRELWEQAIDRYRAALETDSTLTFAQAGLERARRRADLDAKLENLTNNPNLLFDDAVLADARRLLDEAREFAEPDTRIAGQVERLDELVRLASTPVTVELRSDAQTEVTLFKVGELGTFETREVEIRPGTYTALGSRRGYRDVRRTFTVLPGSDPSPIEVICVDAI